MWKRIELCSYRTITSMWKWIERQNLQDKRVCGSGLNVCPSMRNTSLWKWVERLSFEEKYEYVKVDWTSSLTGQIRECGSGFNGWTYRTNTSVWTWIECLTFQDKYEYKDSETSLHIELVKILSIIWILNEQNEEAPAQLEKISTHIQKNTTFILCLLMKFTHGALASATKLMLCVENFIVICVRLDDL